MAARLLLAALSMALPAILLAAARAQPPYHVTIAASGPAAAHAGDVVAYRVDITVEGIEAATVRIDWPFDDADYVSSRLLAGSGFAETEPAGEDLTLAWVAFTPEASIELRLRMTGAAGSEVRVSGYLPGTDVAQFTTATSAVTKIVAPDVPLPDTGSAPKAHRGGPAGVVVGAVLLAAGALIIARVGR